MYSQFSIILLGEKMKKVLCVLVGVILCAGVVYARPPHGGPGPGPGPRPPRPGYCGGPGPCGYRNDGLALAAGICNIVGGVIRDVNTPVYVAPVATPAYVAPVRPYYPPVYTPTIYYHEGRPVAEQRLQVVHTYHVEQNVTGGGTATVVIQER